MIASLPDKFRKLTALSLLACALCTAPSYAWQDDNAEQKQEQVSQAEDDKEKPNITAVDKKALLEKSKTTNRSLYFLGGRPRLLRQQGPAIGKATSILPHPFVPLGSIQVPPPPVNALETSNDLSSERAVVDELAAAGALPQSQDEGSVLALAQDQNQTNNSLEPKIADSEQPLAALPPGSEDALETTALARLDPSGISVAGQRDRYADGFWQGYSRAQIVDRFADYSETTGSPALAYIANKIVLSGIVLDAPLHDADIVAFVEARLLLLKNLGNRKGYIALIEALPRSFDWSPLARYFAEAYLLQGKIADTCSLAAIERADNSDSYWLSLATFCEAARGNRAGVDFQLGILEEVANVQPVFYRLIDQILVEAEQPPGAVLPATVILPTALRIGVLEATMARLARVIVPELAIENVNPLAVGMMLALPGVSIEARTNLLGTALHSGWADGKTMAKFARSLEVTNEEREAALQLQIHDDRFNIDVVLASLVGQPADASVRGAVLKAAWYRALHQNYAAVAGEGLLALTNDLSPNAQNDAGVLARAALISGNTEVAGRWFTALRSQAEGVNAESDVVLVDLAPMMSIAGQNDAPELSLALLQRWWAAQSERPDNYARANLLFTVLEALGNKIDDQAWAWLEAGPVAFEGAVPAPALWRRFLVAAQSGDKPTALAFAFKLLSDGDSSSVSAALSGSVVGTLVELGLGVEARMIATEILISQGL